MRYSLLLASLLMLSTLGLSALSGSDPTPFGECPDGYSCESAPSDAPFPPAAVTGHTVYARFVQSWTASAASTGQEPVRFPSTALSDDLRRNGAPPPAPAEVGSGGGTRVRQAECLAWANGHPLDHRPAAEPWSMRNHFPSDEDEGMLGPVGPAGGGGGDVANQDYDFDRMVQDCNPDLTTAGTPPAASVGLGTDFATVIGYHATESIGPTEFKSFAVVVEKGDCAPSEGFNHRFRGHIDFVDPNHFYHEVQEYDYQCPFSGPAGSPAPDLSRLTGTPSYSDVVNDLYPWTYTDPHNFYGCDAYETPLEEADPAQGDPGRFDYGHKCNGTWQDLFTERFWVTSFHDPVYDPTIDNHYNFAVQIDTCSGFNVFEGFPTPLLAGPGNPASGEDNGFGGDGMTIEAQPFASPVDWYRPLAEVPVVGPVGPSDVMADPLPDVCIDGSSFSFDDTHRVQVVHEGLPGGRGDEDLMRGNAFDFDPDSAGFARHRWNCRANVLEWRFEAYPAGPPPVGADCYAESHRAAEIDIYVYDDDPTGGLFALYSNARTGANAYVQPHAPPTGPGAVGEPPQEPPLVPEPQSLLMDDAGTHHSAPYTATRSFVGSTVTDLQGLMIVRCDIEPGVAAVLFCIDGGGTATIEVTDDAAFTPWYSHRVYDRDGVVIDFGGQCGRSWTFQVPAQAWAVTVESVVTAGYTTCLGVPTHGEVRLDFR